MAFTNIGLILSDESINTMSQNKYLTFEIFGFPHMTVGGIHPAPH